MSPKKCGESNQTFSLWGVVWARDYSDPGPDGFPPPHLRNARAEGKGIVAVRRFFNKSPTAEWLGEGLYVWFLPF